MTPCTTTCAALVVVALTGGIVRADSIPARDCYCTDSTGGRIELSETICLHVGGRMFMAQCQMSLNVPMWREIREGCLSSRRIQPGEPGLDPPAVDPKIRAAKAQAAMDHDLVAGLLTDGGVIGKPPDPRAGDIGHHALGR